MMGTIRSFLVAPGGTAVGRASTVLVWLWGRRHLVPLQVLLFYPCCMIFDDFCFVLVVVGWLVRWSSLLVAVVLSSSSPLLLWWCWCRCGGGGVLLSWLFGFLFVVRLYITYMWPHLPCGIYFP